MKIESYYKWYIILLTRERGRENRVRGIKTDNYFVRESKREGDRG